MKKAATFILIISLILGVTSCGSDATGETPVKSETTTAKETEEITRENYPDSLPDGLNFGGEKFVIHYYDSNEQEWIAEETNGETINDAVYNRNLAVSERLGVEFEFYRGGSAGDYQKFVIQNNLRSSILAGDGAFDLIAGYSSFITRGMDGLLMNLYNVKYLDFDKPWWVSDLVEEATINGKMFYMTGDLALSMLMNMDIMFYNETLSESLFGETFYDQVFDGSWTLDKAAYYIKQASADLNGDGKLDAENDRAGLMMFDRYSGCDAFLGAFRQPVTEKNKDGIPELCVNSERMVTIIERLYDLFWVSEGAYLPTQYHPESEQFSMSRFAAGDCLLFLSRLCGAEDQQMRDMKDEWGILPMPKLDEAQSDYGVYLCDAHSKFCIPVDCKNPDMAGAVTEALAAENYRHLTETYYSVALQTKYARNAETVKVLEMLRPCIVTNFGIVHSVIGGLQVLRNTVMVGKDSMASWYAENESKLKANLADVLKMYDIESD